MNVLPVEQINDEIYNNPRAFVEQCEMMYRRRLSHVAWHIKDSYEETPIVLIAGPSGSGKTTSALRIEAMLNDMGYRTHAISMDNYFIPLNDPRNQRAEDGSIDLESPARLDVELLQQHLRDFVDCIPVEVPMFDFANQIRRYGGVIRREPSDIVIIEGIHALNPDITTTVNDFAIKVYVSVRTRLETGGEVLHPSKIRLMRRLMRDKQFRGRKIPEIMENYKHVEAGEKKYILPFKPLAKFDIDTFLAYEPCVYKRFLLPELVDLSSTYPNYSSFNDIELFLDALDAIPEVLVPFNSLVREFVGGSHFTY